MPESAVASVLARSAIIEVEAKWHFNFACLFCMACLRFFWCRFPLSQQELGAVWRIGSPPEPEFGLPPSVFVVEGDHR
jgi:hypothetical protein